MSWVFLSQVLRWRIHRCPEDVQMEGATMIFVAAPGPEEEQDLQWQQPDSALIIDLPFTGAPSAESIEVCLSPLWRYAGHLLQDANPERRMAGLRIRQRFAYFAVTPGATESLLNLIPCYGTVYDGDDGDDDADDDDDDAGDDDGGGGGGGGGGSGGGGGGGGHHDCDVRSCVS